MTERRFRHIEEGEDVRAEGALELLAGDVVKALLWVLLGGVIDQDIKPPERTYGVLHGLLAEALIADIASDRDTAPAFFFHAGLGLLRIAVLIEVDNDHI